MTAVIGQIVGSYRLVSVLGKGGMGVVYRAEHVKLGRVAALKMLLPQFTHDNAIVQRFFNEARAASAVQHPGIVEVFDYGSCEDGSAYIVMELLDGHTLTTHIEQRAIDPREVASIIAQVAHALAAAHARRILHRDLKPDNIVLVPDPLAPFGVRVKLLDFGIAKLVDDTSSGALKTQTGLVIGTPLYMSPEQCMAAPDIDHRTDLYSLGCILYHALAGRPPFDIATSAGAILAAHLRDVPPDPRVFVSSIPPELVAIVMRLLEKSPADRFQSALELAEALMGRAPSARYSALTPVAGHPTTATGAAAEVMVRDLPERMPKSQIMSFAQVRAEMSRAGMSRADVSRASMSAAGMSAVALPPAPRRSAVLPIAIGVAAIAGAIAYVGVVRMDRGPAAAPVTATPNAAAPPEQRDNDIDTDIDIDNDSPSSHRAPASRDASHDRSSDPWGDSDDEPARDSSRHKARSRAHAKSAPSASASDPASPSPSASAPASSASSMRVALGARDYRPRARVDVSFGQPVLSSPSDRAWLSIAEVGKPPPGLDTWTLVQNGTRRAFLVAPSAPGTYEVRLYRNVDLQATARFTVSTQEGGT